MATENLRAAYVARGPKALPGGAADADEEVGGQRWSPVANR